MPNKVAVEVGKGYSAQYKKLGGKSQRTKDIRSATPRGFAIAIYEANKIKEDTEENYLWTLETTEEFV